MEQIGNSRPLTRRLGGALHVEHQDIGAAGAKNSHGTKSRRSFGQSFTMIHRNSKPTDIGLREILFKAGKNN